MAHSLRRTHELQHFTFSTWHSSLSPNFLTHRSLYLSFHSMNKHSTFIIKQLFPTLLLSTRSPLLFSPPKKLSLSCQKSSFPPRSFPHHLHLYSTSKKKKSSNLASANLLDFSFGLHRWHRVALSSLLSHQNQPTKISPDYAHLWMHFCNVLYTQTKHIDRRSIEMAPKSSTIHDWNWNIIYNISYFL